MNTKVLIWILVVVLIIGGGIYFFTQRSSYDAGIEEEETVEPGDTETPDAEVVDETKTIIGTSVEGRDITAYHYLPAQAGGDIDTDLLFVGGIHGGYEWNTVLVAYELMDYLEANPDVIPANERVTVVPVLNPDGLNKTVGTAGRFDPSDVPATQAETVPGRFNANNVDLNRNFDCDWKAEGMWQNTTVDGGTAAFSEPESKAIRDYIEANTPDAVVVWYSAAGGVFASDCHSGVLPETNTITGVYAEASGYPAYQSFDFYAITGDMVNWLAKEGIPAISVLLTNHTDTEWAKNEAGVEALLEHYKN